MSTRLSLITWACLILTACINFYVSASGLRVVKTICGSRVHHHQRIQHKAQEACQRLPHRVSQLDGMVANKFDPLEFRASGKIFTAEGPYYIYPLGKEGNDQSYRGPDRIMINENCEIATILTEKRKFLQKTSMCFRNLCKNPNVPPYRQQDFNYEECILHVLED